MACETITEKRYQQEQLETILTAWYHACHGQVEPDGNNCAICSDNDHQAFECRFNKARSWLKLIRF